MLRSPSLLALLVTVLLAALACGLRQEAVTPPASSLQELQTLGQLQATFNRDEGTTRLIPLLSPT